MSELQDTAAASLGAGRIAALQQLTLHPQHHRRPAGFTLCTREIPAGRSVCTSGSSLLRRKCQPRMPPSYRAAPMNPETTCSCSRGAAGMSSLGEAALGSLGPPGLALVSSLSRHRSSCPRPRWPRGSFPALAMGLWVLTQRRPEEHRVQGLELQLLPVAAVGHFEHCPHHGGVVHCQPAQQGKTTSCGHIHQHQERTRD